MYAIPDVQSSKTCIINCIKFSLNLRALELPSDSLTDIRTYFNTTNKVMNFTNTPCNLPMADRVSQSLVTVILTVQGNQIRDRSLQQTLNNVLDRADYCEGLAKRLDCGRGWFDPEYS